MLSRKVWILRLTHRVERDKRVTTHLALVARAFGAQGMYYTGDQDPSLEDKIRDVVERWGGKFSVEYVDNPVQLIRKWILEKGQVVHLTMYRMPLPDVIDDVRRHDKILVVVGSEKVDPVFFDLATYNVSVTTQPHSEIAALAVFLDYYYQGAEFKLDFPGAKYKVIPIEKNKKVVKLR